MSVQAIQQPSVASGIEGISHALRSSTITTPLHLTTDFFSKLHQSPLSLILQQLSTKDIITFQQTSKRSACFAKEELIRRVDILAKDTIQKCIRLLCFPINSWFFVGGAHFSNVAIATRQLEVIQKLQKLTKTPLIRFTNAISFLYDADPLKQSLTLAQPLYVRDSIQEGLNKDLNILNRDFTSRIKMLLSFTKAPFEIFNKLFPQSKTYKDIARKGDIEGLLRILLSRPAYDIREDATFCLQNYLILSDKNTLLQAIEITNRLIPPNSQENSDRQNLRLTALARISTCAFLLGERKIGTELMTPILRIKDFFSLVKMYIQVLLDAEHHDDITTLLQQAKKDGIPTDAYTSMILLQPPLYGAKEFVFSIIRELDLEERKKSIQTSYKAEQENYFWLLKQCAEALALVGEREKALDIIQPIEFSCDEKGDFLYKIDFAFENGRLLRDCPKSS